MVSRGPEDFRRVAATAAELVEWREAHAGRYPSVYRVQCRACGKRLWGSGLGIGSHRRACPELAHSCSGSFGRWVTGTVLPVCPVCHRSYRALGVPEPRRGDVVPRHDRRKP